MLYKGKYYVGCYPNFQIQVKKTEHERIRILLNQAFVEVFEKDLAYIWIDDPSCDD